MPKDTASEADKAAAESVKEVAIATTINNDIIGLRILFKNPTLSKKGDKDMLTAILMILGIILLSQKLYGIGAIAIAVGIYLWRKPKKKKEDICEFDIYRQAADIEKNLKEDRR